MNEHRHRERSCFRESTTSHLRVTGPLALAFAAGLAGCAAQEEPLAGDEEDLVETTSALVVGCAAIVETGEAHTGGLIGYSTPKPEIVVDQIKFKISNPSDTDCASVRIDWNLTNDTYGTVLGSYGVTTSLHAHKYRWVWSYPAFDSRTHTPKVGYDEDVWTYRNGNLMRATYLPQYFVNTGQY